VAGDFNFDATRMMFENVTAESGGGHRTLAAPLLMGRPPELHAQWCARSDSIRYSRRNELAVSGALRLSGNSQAATLSGRIVVDRC